MLEYLHLFSYHPLNPTSFEMTEILQTTHSERSLIKIEDKITTYSHHKSFLKKITKINKKIRLIVYL